MAVVRAVLPTRTKALNLYPQARGPTEYLWRWVAREALEYKISEEAVAEFGWTRSVALERRRPLLRVNAMDGETTTVNTLKTLVCAAQTSTFSPQTTVTACLIVTTTVLRVIVSAAPGTLDSLEDCVQLVTWAHTRTFLVLQRACHALQGEFKGRGHFPLCFVA